VPHEWFFCLHAFSNLAKTKALTGKTNSGRQTLTFETSPKGKDVAGSR
jgi:hypothetical protein